MLFPRENPLLRDFTVPPFGEISEREFEPAIMDAMEMHKDEIAEILGNHHRPSFSNTIEPFTMSDLTLDKAVSTFFNLYAAASTPGMETLAARLAPLLSAHEDSIMHNSKLFSRIRFVYTHFPKRITPEQAFAVWQEILRTAFIEIAAVTPNPRPEIETQLAAAFHTLERQPVPVKFDAPSPLHEPVCRETERMPLGQTKLVLTYKYNRIQMLWTVSASSRDQIQAILMRSGR